MTLELGVFRRETGIRDPVLLSPAKALLRVCLKIEGQNSLPFPHYPGIFGYRLSASLEISIRIIQFVSRIFLSTRKFRKRVCK
jgi:hypothetical protein